MNAAWEILVMITCVWAAIVGTLLGRDIWRWFWDREDE